MVFIFSCNRNEDNLATNIIVSSSEKINKNNPYGVESGIVKYKITLSGKLMDNIIEGKGQEIVYFDKWGNKIIKEEKITKTTKTNVFNKVINQSENIHHIQKLENEIIYKVDFKNQKINTYKKNNTELIKHNNNNLLEKYGGKKLINEVFKGYDCEVWDVSGTKQWLYKGVPLKTEVTIMGIKTTKEAISANFNVLLTESEFNLPDYPIIKE